MRAVLRATLCLAGIPVLFGCSATPEQAAEDVPGRVVHKQPGDMTYVAKPDPLVCERTRTTGSKISRQVCIRQSEREQIRQQAKEAVYEVQDQDFPRP
jgi:hypothetical protein